MKDNPIADYGPRPTSYWRLAMLIVVLGVALLTGLAVINWYTNSPRSVFRSGMSRPQLHTKITPDDYADLARKADKMAGKKHALGDRKVLEASQKVAKHLSEVADFLGNGSFPDPEAVFGGKRMDRITALHGDYTKLRDEFGDENNSRDEYVAIVKDFLDAEGKVWRSLAFGDSKDDDIRECLQEVDPARPLPDLGRLDSIFHKFKNAVERTGKAIGMFVLIAPDQSILRDFLDPMEKAAECVDPKNATAGADPKLGPLGAFSALNGARPPWLVVAKCLVNCRNENPPATRNELSEEKEALLHLAGNPGWGGLGHIQDLAAPRIQLIDGLLRFDRELVENSEVPAPVELPAGVELSSVESSALGALRKCVVKLREIEARESALGSCYAAPAEVAGMFEPVASDWAALDQAEDSAPLPRRLKEFIAARSKGYRQLLDAHSAEGTEPLERFLAQRRLELQSLRLSPLELKGAKALFRFALWCRRGAATIHSPTGQFLEDARRCQDPSEEAWAQWAHDMIQARSEWLQADSFATVRRLSQGWKIAPDNRWPATPSPALAEEINLLLRYASEFDEDDLKDRAGRRAEVGSWRKRLGEYVEWRDRVTAQKAPQPVVAAQMPRETMDNWKEVSRRAAYFIESYLQYIAGAQNLLAREDRMIAAAGADGRGVAEEASQIFTGWKKLETGMKMGPAAGEHARYFHQLLRELDVAVDGGLEDNAPAGIAALRTVAKRVADERALFEKRGDDSLARLAGIFVGAAGQFESLIRGQAEIFAPFDTISAPDRGEAAWRDRFGKDYKRWKNLRRVSDSRVSSLEIYENAAGLLLGCRCSVQWSRPFRREIPVTVIASAKIPCPAWGTAEENAGWAAELKARLEAIECPVELLAVWKAMNRELGRILEARATLTQITSAREHDRLRETFVEIGRHAVTEMGAYMARIEAERLDWMLETHRYTVASMPATRNNLPVAGILGPVVGGVLGRLSDGVLQRIDWAYLSMTNVDPESASVSSNDFEIPSLILNDGTRYRAIARCTWSKDLQECEMTVPSGFSFSWGMRQADPLALKIVKPSSYFGIFKVCRDLAWRIEHPDDIAASSLTVKVVKQGLNAADDAFLGAVTGVRITKKDIEDHKLDMRDVGYLHKTEFVLYRWTAPNPRDSLSGLAKICGLKGPEEMGFPFPWPGRYDTLTLSDAPRPVRTRAQIENLVEKKMSQAIQEHISIPGFRN